MGCNHDNKARQSATIVDFVSPRSLLSLIPLSPSFSPSTPRSPCHLPSPLPHSPSLPPSFPLSPFPSPSSPQFSLSPILLSSHSLSVGTLCSMITSVQVRLEAARLLDDSTRQQLMAASAALQNPQEVFEYGLESGRNVSESCANQTIYYLSNVQQMWAIKSKWTHRTFRLI